MLIPDSGTLALKDGESDNDILKQLLPLFDLAEDFSQQVLLFRYGPNSGVFLIY